MPGYQVRPERSWRRAPPHQVPRRPAHGGQGFASVPMWSTSTRI